ncbi:MAG: hypothetical protein AAGJ35_13840, partial [Myxococcota bacterium]
WSSRMWRSELVYEIELYFATPSTALVDATPILPQWYRFMGATIGEAVCLHSAFLMEADLVTIENHASIQGVLQTHLFEDRVMKLGHILVQEDCTVGHHSVVLYSSKMGRASGLGPLSLIMKSETFSPELDYRGLPAEQIA